MSNPSFEFVEAAAKAAADPAYGYPGICRRERMSLRNRKKKHLFPYTALIGDITVVTTRDLTREECPNVKISNSEYEADDLLVETIIEIAERIGAGVYISWPFENPREVKFVADVYQSRAPLREQFDVLTAFAEALLSIPTVSRVNMKLQDGWFVNAAEDIYSLADFEFANDE